MSDIKNLIIKLNDQLLSWSEEYYLKNEPSVSDQVYDAQLQRLNSLVKENPDFASYATALLNVGSKIDNKFKKVRHSTRMLSLANAFNFQDIIDFDKRIKNELGINNGINYVSELKIDGLSISLIYSGGKLVQGITRGDGEVGEDVTHNILEIKDIPKIIQYKNYIEVRGEIYMPISSFDLLNKKSEIKFANPRNAASGSIRQLDSSIVRNRNLSCFIYQIVNPESHNISNHKKSLIFLDKLGFKVNESIYSKDINSVIDSIDKLSKSRNDHDYETDGIVIKVNDFNLYEDIGYTAKYPKSMIAYKFPEEISETKILDIFPKIGRTGRVTYNAKLLPVRLGGTTVSAATLHNADYIRQIGINIGDIVKVKKAGEIIPKVLGYSQKINNQKWIESKECPGCHTKLLRFNGEVDQYCTNEECPLQNIAKFEHFVSRKAMDIEGISTEIIKKFINNGLITDLPSIFDLPKREEELLNLEGFKTKSVKNIISSIEKSKSQDLSKFIFALGIRHVGEKYSKILAKRLGSLDKIISAQIDEFIKIREFGPKVSSSLVEYFSNDKNIKMISEMINKGLKLSSIESNNSSLFENKTFVLTGTLSKPRKYFQDLIEQNSGNISSSVSSKTSYLLYGSDPGSKLKKAKSLGIKSITEKELLKMLEDKNV